MELLYLACLRIYLLDAARKPLDAGTQEILESPRCLLRLPGLIFP